MAEELSWQLLTLASIQKEDEKNKLKKRPPPAEDGYTAAAELLKTYQSAVRSLMYAMLGTSLCRFGGLEVFFQPYHCTLFDGQAHLPLPARHRSLTPPLQGSAHRPGKVYRFRRGWRRLHQYVIVSPLLSQLPSRILAKSS